MVHTGGGHKCKGNQYLSLFKEDRWDPPEKRSCLQMLFSSGQRGHG